MSTSETMCSTKANATICDHKKDKQDYNSTNIKQALGL